MVAAAARHRASQRPPGPDPKSPWRAGFPAVPGWGVRERPGEGTPGSVCAGSASAGAWEASERLRPRRPRIPSLEPRSGARTKRRVSLAPALWPTALPGSGSDGEVVVSRGALAERPLARGLPAERQGARQGGLGSGRGSGFPRERAPWRRGRGRGPGAGGWAGRARRASAPSPAEHPCRDGLVQGRPVCAGQQEGWVARVPGGRQAGAARPRTHGGEGSRARGTPLAGKAGARPPRCGWGAQAGRRGGRGGRGAGLAGELAGAAVEARLPGRVGRSPGRCRSAGEARRACHPPRGCVLRRGRGRGGARRGRGSGRGRMGEGGRG